MRNTKAGFYAMLIAFVIMFVTPFVYFFADEWGISGEIVSTDMYANEHVLFATVLGDFFINPPSGVKLALGPLTIDSSYDLQPNPGMAVMLIVFFIVSVVGIVTMSMIIKDSYQYRRDAMIMSEIDVELYKKYEFLRGFDLLPYFDGEKRNYVFDGERFYPENCH